MANPDWTINLLERSETVVDFFRRGALKSSSSISDLGDAFRLSVAGIPVPPGKLYHSMSHCFVSNFAEGCAIGGGISVLVSVIPSLLKGNLSRAMSAVVATGNFRVAVFFGSLMSICNTGVYLQRATKNHDSKRYGELSRLLIGFVSGMSVLVLPKGIRRFIVYFLFTRSLEVLARLVRSRRLLAGQNLFSVHEIVGLASGSMAVIITAWFRYTHLVPKGYLTFLKGINNLTQEQVGAVQRVLQQQGDCGGSEQTRKILNREIRMCALIHPDCQSCSDFFTNFVLKGIFTRSGPFYIKLYSLPFILSIVIPNKSKPKISIDSARQFASRVWWSSLFLATLNATVAGTVCLMSKFKPLASSRAVPLTFHASLGGAASAISLYLEQDSRRLELALYLFGQAIQILATAYAGSGLWYPKRGLDILVTASSISLMTFAFWHQEAGGNGQDLIRPGYAKLIRKIVDTTDHRHSFIFKY